VQTQKTATTAKSDGCIWTYMDVVWCLYVTFVYSFADDILLKFPVAYNRIKPYKLIITVSFH